MKTRQQMLEEISFTRIPFVGPILARQLLAYCGSIEAVFSSSIRQLKTIPGIGDEIASHISRSTTLRETASEEMKFMERQGVQYTFFTDPEFPRRLQHLQDAPLILYTRGHVELNPERSVGIIGTRKPTPHGKTICEEIVTALESFDVTIISGLAYGIDITAHKTCLRLGIPTIGVMGCGMGTIYPSVHTSVALDMMEKGGLITEFSHDTGPDAVNFPMRNRIVAGLCDLLVVVESGLQGGSMITATLANDYNRDVAAVPGRKSDKYSRGCNFLIKSQQAHLIESGEDLIQLMRWHRQTQKQSFQGNLFTEMSDQEQKIYRLIVETGEKDIDTLAYESKTTPGGLAAVLLSLELKGAVRTLPGKKYAAIC